MLKKLLGLSQLALKERLDEIFANNNIVPKGYLAKQVWNGLYHNGYSSFDKFSTISKCDYNILKSPDLEIGYGDILQNLLSKDGTRKLLLGYGPKRKIETVFIPKISRDTSNFGSLCVSSQIGCSLACKFCHTGTQKFMGNLESSEIIAQVMSSMHLVGDFPNPVNSR
jgi:23S rRNA (adenine2503-C2)-methyltransferase